MGINKHTLSIVMALIALVVLLFIAQGLAAADAVRNPRDVPVPPALDCTFVQNFIAEPELFVFLDARAPDEYSEGHIPDAINIPYDRVAEFSAALPDDPDRAIVTYCRSGRRATLLRDALIELGYTNVTIVPGGQLETAGNGLRFTCGS